MKGVYKAVISNQKAMRKLELIKKSLIRQQIRFSESDSQETLKINNRDELESFVTYETHPCCVVIAEGKAVVKKSRIKKTEDLGTYRGVSPVEYIPSEDDLAFFEETAKLPPIR